MTWPWIACVTTLALLTAVQGLALIGIITRTTPLLTHLEALLSRPVEPRPHPGTALPHLDLHDSDGRTVPTATLGGQTRVLLLANAYCPSCLTLLTRLAQEQGPAPDLPVTLVTAADSLGELRALDLPHWLDILCENDTALSDALQIDSTPLALLLGPDQRVRSTAVPHTPAELRTLATRPAMPGARGGDQHAAIG